MQSVYKRGSRGKDAPRPTTEELYELYWKQGKTQREIAQVYGVTESSVQRWIMRNGCQKKRQRPNDSYAYKQRRMVLVAYESGSDRYGLAVQYDVEVRTIDRWLHRARKEREQG